MNAARIVLVALASARATRFVTSDHLGEWWLVGPLKRWAWREELPITSVTDTVRSVDPNLEHNRAETTPTPPAEWGWRSKLVKGLDCPFCVGFWIGGLVLAGEALTRYTPLRVLRPAWTFLLGMAGLNYVVGHVSSRIDG